MRVLIAASLLTAAAAAATPAVAVDILNCASISPSTGWVGGVDRCTTGTGTKCVEYGPGVYVHQPSDCVYLSPDLAT